MELRKRIGALLAAGAMLCGTAGAMPVQAADAAALIYGDQLSIPLADALGYYVEGTENYFAYSLCIENNPGYAAAGISLTFDEGIYILPDPDTDMSAMYTAGEAASSTVYCTRNQERRIAGYSCIAQQNTTADGTIVTYYLQFTKEAAETLQAGRSLDVVLTVRQFEDRTGTELDYSVQDGSITIEDDTETTYNVSTDLASFTGDDFTLTESEAKQIVAGSDNYLCFAVTMNENPGLSSIALSLSYNTNPASPALIPVKDSSGIPMVDNGDVLSGMAVSTALDESQSKFTISASGASATDTTGTVFIVYLQFSDPSVISAGKLFSLPLEVVALRDANGEEYYNYSTEYGSIHIVPDDEMPTTPVIYGDQMTLPLDTALESIEGMENSFGFPVWIADNPGFANAGIRVTVGEDLYIPAESDSDVTPIYYLGPASPTPANVSRNQDKHILGYSAAGTENATEDGALFTVWLQFSKAAAAKIAKDAVFPVTVEVLRFDDISGEALTYDMQNGFIRIGDTEPDPPAEYPTSGFCGEKTLTKIADDEALKAYLGDDAYAQFIEENPGQPYYLHQFGENLTWKLDDAGTLTISGSGLMYEFRHVADTGFSAEYGGMAPEWDKSAVKRVVIEDGVLSIGGSAFAFCENLESIDIAESVVAIGDNAFVGTKWLADQPDGMVYINNCAYEWKGEYPSVIEIKEGTTYVAPSCFARFNIYGSASLDFKLPDTLLDLSFLRLTPWLSEQPEGVAVKNNVLVGYQGDTETLTELTVAEGIQGISAGAFCSRTDTESFFVTEFSALKTVTIPASVQLIGDGAFSEVPALESITILNPDCIILDGESDAIATGYINETTEGGWCPSYFTGTIYGYTNSTAQAYAERHDYKFVSLGEPPVGDVTLDGEVGLRDAVILARALGGQTTGVMSPAARRNADLNADGTVNDEDLTLLLRRLAGLK